MAAHTHRGHTAHRILLGTCDTIQNSHPTSAACGVTSGLALLAWSILATRNGIHTATQRYPPNTQNGGSAFVPKNSRPHIDPIPALPWSPLNACSPSGPALATPCCPDYDRHPAPQHPRPGTGTQVPSRRRPPGTEASRPPFTSQSQSCPVAPRGTRRQTRRKGVRGGRCSTSTSSSSGRTCMFSSSTRSPCPHRP